MNFRFENEQQAWDVDSNQKENVETYYNRNSTVLSCLPDVDETIMIDVPQIQGDITIKQEECDLEMCEPDDTDMYELSDVEPLIYDLCRICALPNDELVCIFGEEGIRRQLQQKINYCLPVQVEATDILPQSICHQCIKQLEQSYKLASICLEAEQTLKKKYEKLHPGFQPIEPFDFCCTSELDTPSPISDQAAELPSQDSKEVSIKVRDVSEKPSKLNFEFVKKLPSSKLPTTCRICNLLLCTADNATKHYAKQHNKTVCVFCYETFDENYNLSEHINEKHTLNCGLCEFKVVGPGEHILKKHFRQVHAQVQPQKPVIAKKKKRAPFFKPPTSRKTSVCQYCSKQFNSKASTKEHYVTSHKKYVCVFCWQDFSAEQLLETHIKSMSHDVICGLCKAEFSIPRGLTYHMTVMHKDGNDNTYDCNICSGTYQSKFHLNNHYKKCHGLYLCIICGAYFNTETEMTNHMQMEKHMECEKCSDKFETWEEFTEHVETHSALQCKQCNKKFVASHNLRSHIRHVHQKKPYKYKCTMCSLAFKTPMKLRAHMIRHGNQKNAVCQVCGKKFYDTKSLSVHMECHAEERKFVCDQCGRSFKHYRNLTAHIGAVHIQWEYMCALCNKSYASEADVVVHFNQHTDEDRLGFVGKPFLKASPFHCEICDKYFASKLYHSIHMKKYHCNEDGSQMKQFKCDVCKRVFSSKHNMFSHYSQKHLTSKQFYCDLCNTAYLTNARLALHMKNFHENAAQKTYDCVHCDKVFTKYQNLSIHLRSVHYRIRKYKCPTCNKAFVRSSHLKQHMPTHTGVKAFKCDICFKAYSQVGDMRRHRAKHSPVPVEAESYGIILLAST